MIQRQESVLNFELLSFILLRPLIILTFTFEKSIFGLIKYSLKFLKNIITDRDTQGRVSFFETRMWIENTENTT